MINNGQSNEKNIEIVNNKKVNWTYINIIYGISFTKNSQNTWPAIKSISTLAKNIGMKLIVANPTKYTKRFTDFGANILTTL